jgi:hypothetical protein
MYYVLTGSDYLFSIFIYVLTSGTLSNVRDVYRLYFVQINFYARLNILDKFSIGVTFDYCHFLQGNTLPV